MKRKTIDASRELRLWIGQVIVPAIGVGLVIRSNPELQKAVVGTFNNIKTGIKNRFTR